MILVDWNPELVKKTCPEDYLILALLIQLVSQTDMIMLRQLESARKSSFTLEALDWNQKSWKANTWNIVPTKYQPQ